MPFSRQFEDLDDDGFEGSIDEQRISYDIFFGSDDSSKKGCIIPEAADIHHDCIKETDASNSGKSSLTSQDDYAKADFSGKQPLEYLSVDLTSSVVSNHDGKLPIGDMLDWKPHSEGVNSGLSLENTDSSHHILTYCIVESSGQGVITSSYELKPNPQLHDRCEIRGGNTYKDATCGLDQNEVANRVVTSPISQESHESRLKVTDSPANNVDAYRTTKPKWKDSCFVKLSEEELARPMDIKNDPRPLLRYHINRLLIAAGWVIGRRKRNSKYNGIGEYVYKSPGGRPFREFSRAWCMCGESLLNDSASLMQTSGLMQWADANELWNDLSQTVQEIEDKFNVLENTSDLAYLWFLLDPFANVVFIDKTIRLFKEGITVKSRRSFFVPSDAGSSAKYQKISKSETFFDGTNQIDACLVDVPIDSVPSQSLEASEPIFCQQDESTRSPSFFQMKNDEGVFGDTRNSHKKSRKLSDMKLAGTGTQVGEINHAKRGSKKSKACRLNDDDLLISAIMKTMTGKATNKWSTRKSTPRKPRSLKGSCKLLPRSLKKGAKNIMEQKWSLVGSRTVLSWLIHSHAVSVNETIQYRNTKDDSVMKSGVITRDGILCKCCNTVLSLSEFKSHAGFKLSPPCMNLFMESGKPVILCQLEAWSAEYRARKVTPQIQQANEEDHNDDSCGRCGDVGELICCDNCPSAFHQTCLYEQDLPEGNWYCPQCRCQICSDAVNDNETSQLHGDLKCSQCELRYHEKCMQSENLEIGLSMDAWFCGYGCNKVYTGLQSRIGLQNFLCDGYSWTLLRCIPSDQKVNSVQRAVALRAECNSKLSVAITIMEECFLPMVDMKTGIDMIPQVIYNWGSQFSRLNFSGFYTVVLEKDDIVLCVASIRIHGVAVAELPLVATCSKYRRQGMCRRLIDAIEEMLKSLKVKKLVVSAIPTLVDTWTASFGFQAVEDDERRSLSKTNLMVFPGSVWLKKTLYENSTMDETSERKEETEQGHERDEVEPSARNEETDAGYESSQSGEKQDFC